MLFAVIFRDKPGYGDTRAKHLDAHIRWLEENKESVMVAGSLRESPEQVPLGGDLAPEKWTPRSLLI